jgi:nitroimidazol reductase NimA-like FMN-containing flavoprotein (pyridoxamine 5'-phosphate oxidase superfamily)
MADSLFTPAVAAYLDSLRIPIRLACVTPSGWPRVLSLWYLRDGDTLCCATARTAQVVSYLRQEARCAFEIAADTPPYCGVRGQAMATVDDARGEEVLLRLLDRYLGGYDSSLARWLLARRHQEVALVLAPVSLSTWNYSPRMQDTLPAPASKICP